MSFEHQIPTMNAENEPNASPTGTPARDVAENTRAADGDSASNVLSKFATTCMPATVPFDWTLRSITLLNSGPEFAGVLPLLHMVMPVVWLSYADNTGKNAYCLGYFGPKARGLRAHYLGLQSFKRFAADPGGELPVELVAGKNVRFLDYAANPPREIPLPFHIPPVDGQTVTTTRYGFAFDDDACVVKVSMPPIHTLCGYFDCPPPAIPVYR